MRGFRRLMLVCLSIALSAIGTACDDGPGGPSKQDLLKASEVPYLTAGYDPGIGGVRVGWLPAVVAPKGYAVRRIGPLELSTAISEATAEATTIAGVGPETQLYEDLDIVPGQLYGYVVGVEGSKKPGPTVWVPILSEFAGIPVAAPEVDEACSPLTDPEPYQTLKPADLERAFPTAASGTVAWQAQIRDADTGVLLVGYASTGGSVSFPREVTAGFIRGCETRELLFDARPIPGTPTAVRLRALIADMAFEINFPNDAAEERVRMSRVSPEPGKIMRPGWHRFDAEATWKVIDRETRQLTWLLIGHKRGGGTRILDAEPVVLDAVADTASVTLDGVVTSDLERVTFAARFTVQTPDAIWIEDFVQYAVVP